MTRKLLLVVLCAGLVSSACGTRRDDTDFSALSSSGGQAVTEGAVAGGAAGPAGDVAAGDVPAGDAAAAAGGDTPVSGPAGAVDPGTAAGGAPTTKGGKASGPAAGGGAPGAGAGPTAGAGAGGPATASDVGVTPTTITLGNVVSYKGLAGPDQFPPYYYGAASFFNDLNARGGINGRKVVFQTCDDAYTTSGNVKCVRDLVEKSKVFALVANACGVCDGLTFASDKAVPSINGLATDFRSYALPHNWDVSGNPYPTNGKIGFKGKVYYGTSAFRFFNQKYGIKKAGIVYYDNAAPSKNAALGFAQQMKLEGITPYLYGLNVALPQYDSAVIDMKSRGVTGLWDAIDIVGNQNLCKSIDSNGLKLTAKVSSSAAWTESVGSTFSSPCRKTVFSTEAPASVPYSDTSNPEVAKFRAAYKRYFPDRQGKLYQWTLDGWATAMRFTDAATACGANLTRACLEKNLDAAPYTARGLWSPRSNEKIDFDKQKTIKECLSVVQWDDSVNTFAPRTVKTCYTTPLVGQNIS